MNQDPNINLKASICRDCGDGDQRYLINIWDGKETRTLCPSCILRSQKESFCPTCFAIHDPTIPPSAVCCYKCRSYSHVDCFSANCGTSKAPPTCSSCINPSRLTLTLRKVKSKGENLVAMDLMAATLFLTAAKVAALTMVKAIEASNSVAEMKIKEKVPIEKKATDATYHVKKHVDNTCNQGEDENYGSLLSDSSNDGEEDGLPEALRESGGPERLAIEGADSEAQIRRPPIYIDLNAEYPSEDDDGI